MHFFSTLLIMVCIASVSLADDPHGTVDAAEDHSEKVPRPVAINEDKQEFVFDVTDEAVLKKLQEKVDELYGWSAVTSGNVSALAGGTTASP